VIRAIGFITVAVFAAVFPISAAYQIVLPGTHEGALVAADWHEKSDVLVSAGVDGRLIVTRPTDGKVLRRFHVSENPIHDLKVDPTWERVALVTSENGNFTVSVWDWNDEEVVYSYEMDSEPLFVAWSAESLFLIIGNLDIESVAVLEGESGRQLHYLQSLTAFYSAGYIGATESILMTYHSFGIIEYWDIRSSTLRLAADTVSNLKGITVLQTEPKNTLFGYRNETLYSINRQNGAIQDERVVPNLYHVSMDRESGEIDILAKEAEGYVLHEYVLREGKIMERGSDNPSSLPLALDNSLLPSMALRRNSTSFILSESGKIYSKHEDIFTPIAHDPLWKPDSLAFHNTTLLASGGGLIREYSSPFFDVNTPINLKKLKTLSFKERRTSSKAKRTVISVLPDGDILQWDAAYMGPDNGIRRISRYEESESFLPLSKAIHKMKVIDSKRILIVDRYNTVSILSTADGELLFQHSALSIMDALYLDDSESLIIARVSKEKGATPLEGIGLNNEEAIPYLDSRSMVYSIRKAPLGFHSIGIGFQDSGRSRTSLLFHDENPTVKPQTLLEIPGEDQQALVLTHPKRNSVYTTLGGTVQHIAGTDIATLPWERSITELNIHGDILYGLDEDGAIAMWNSQNGRILLKIHLFKDTGWIAISPDGEKIWSSPGTIRHVMIYKDGKAVDWPIDYEIIVPQRLS